MNKILVPYDFSDCSKNALNFATRLAERIEATEVVLFNVIESPSESRLKYMGATQADPMESVFMNKMIKNTEAKLDEVISNVLSKTTVVRRLEIGNPFVSLSKAVADTDVDLVVMGTQGADGLEELFVGSNAEKIVRFAKCPVITLKETVSPEDIKELVFASNFHELSSEFIDRIKVAQRLFNAQLRIVKINTPANFTTTRHDLDQMESFVKDNLIDNCTIDIYNYHNEEDGIINFAEDINADMIILGTRQKRGVKHFLAGSIAEDVVNSAKRPVVTIHMD